VSTSAAEATTAGAAPAETFGSPTTQVSSCPDDKLVAGAGPDGKLVAGAGADGKLLVGREGGCAGGEDLAPCGFPCAALRNAS